MNIETVENVITLLSVILALLVCLFRYIDAPRRAYLYLCGYFLAHLLSDYYWSVYSIVMNDYPDVSEFIAYFGWNISYLLLAGAVLHTRTRDSGRYFHPLILLPVPVNIIQFLLYIQFGGIFNNLWSGLTLTAVAVICMQSIMYYVKNRDSGVHFPHLHAVTLLYVAMSYGMWTSSCYDWPGNLANPYYYFSLAGCCLAVILPWAAGKDYEADGLLSPEKNSDEIKFQVRIQAALSFVLLGMCAGGFYFAIWMRNSIPAGGEGSGFLNIIAIMLFALSVVMVLLILALIYVIALRYKTTKDSKQDPESSSRKRFNLLLTLVITLGLMIFSVIYNSRLYYDVAVERVYEAGEEKVQSTADDLVNYLTLAESTLKVTADTVEMMIKNGEPQEKIEQYILEETQNQKTEFDENFTGLYAYVRGQYVDGLGWVPPEGYDPETRDWYKEAVKAGGRTIIVSPYVDMQTHSVVITICKMMSRSETGGYNVAALDVIVNHIQDVTQKIEIGGKGYAMVVNEDGLIVAHHKPEMNGTNAMDVLGPEMFSELLAQGNTKEEAVIDGKDSTLFISRVMDQWYVIIVVSNTELLEDTRSQLMVNVIVSLVIFALISVFYYLGYKNEQAYGKKVEEMRVSRQKQEYEAEVLRLEKLAADEANKAKSGFLADMSHEIRTPINVMLGMNEMIIRETGETNVLEYARNIKSSGRNLLQLINSILDFSKIEDGKMEIVPVRYRVNSLVTYLINSVRERAKAKNLRLIINIDPNIPSELFGDDTRIEQVILNLLTNAVKYTPEGSVTLSISEKERTKDKTLLLVEVKDTGIGIKESDMERLFESFERLEVIRNRNIEGTGLGISISTKLLELMGSELMVESRYGEGSVFSFELWQKIENEEPLGEYDELEADDADIHSYRESFHAPDARILIVDDTNMNIIVAVSLLKETDIGIDTALSGQDAVKLAGENHYDVILLDQRMPGMDGTQTLHAIRDLENGINRDTPIICLTADAIRGARERYMAQGFSDYLTKPLEGRDLEKALIAYLPREKVIRTTDEANNAAKRQPEVTDDELPSGLSEAGIDTVQGMLRCQNDVNIYRTILSEFAKEYERKSGNLRKFYEDRAWDDYAIIIHSVKSSAKTIGADKLSEHASILEKAANEKDTAVIERDHAETLRLFKEVSDAIKDSIPVPEYPGDSEEDVFEFSPDDVSGG